MKLSEAIQPAAARDIFGKEEWDFSFLEEFSCESTSVNPRLTLLGGIIERELKKSLQKQRTRIEQVILSILSLLGGSTSGLAVCLPPNARKETGVQTVIINLARHLSVFALETDAIGDEEFDFLDDLLRQIDCVLLRIHPNDWPELTQVLPGNEHVLMSFHLDLSKEELYGRLVPYWQRAISAKLGSGNLIAPSSLNAFLTPLRHFTKHFPSKGLPKNLHHMTQEELDRFAHQIRYFFTDTATFSISRRTQEDYVSAVIFALKADPGVEKSKVWSWKYSSHVSQLDDDPSDEEGVDEGYSDTEYLAAVRKTAESIGDLETLASLIATPQSSRKPCADFAVDGVQAHDSTITHKELALLHHYSNERYAMASFHSPFSQGSLSMHVICTFDHWLRTHFTGRHMAIWALLFHLLLVTGRNLEWALSIRIGSGNPDIDNGTPCYDPNTGSITTVSMLKMKLPGSPAADSVRPAYLPVSHHISLPLSAKARVWIEQIHGDCLRGNTDSLLLVQPDGSPFTKNDVGESLLQPFADFMLSRQPGLPALTLGRIRKAFWSLFTWQGLSPEDATMISDQYYLDIRAPMFYACRPIREFHQAYRNAYSRVGKSLLQIYGDLFPKTPPMTFSGDSDPFQSALPNSDVHFGSCYCPRQEKLRQLVAAIIDSLSEEWVTGDPRRRHDLLSYACAFGISLGLGLRVGETAGLTCQSIDHQTGTIAVSGKSDRFFEEMRILPIPMPLREPLIRLTAENHDMEISSQPESPFFKIFQGRTVASPLSRERLWRQLRSWENKAGMEEAVFRWHALRHAMASHLLRDGYLTFPERSYFLGHVAGQQWLEDLQPGEQLLVFDQFAFIVGRMMGDLGYDLSAFIRIESKEQP